MYFILALRPFLRVPLYARLTLDQFKISARLEKVALRKA